MKNSVFSCIELFLCTILVIFCSIASADIDENADKSLEQRLHNIYVKHYSTEVLDADWFKIADTVESQDYQVKPGDTLWSISKIYFGDGFYWSKLWSVNQTITNPHLILANDTLHFRSGSFKAAPSISIEQADRTETTENGEATEVASGDQEESEGPALAVTRSIEPASNLPAMFKEFVPLRELVKPPKALVVGRPPLHFTSTKKLTMEILAEKPKVLGRVKSLGTNRILTGEVSTVVFSSDTALSTGSMVSVVDADFSTVKKGYFVKALALLKVVRSIGDDLYEGRVLEQFDGMPVGSKISTYDVRTVDLDIGEGDPLDVPVDIIRANDKTFWSIGDVIFLDSSKKSLSSGDVLNVSNKYSENVDFFQHAGLIKIVSVSPPYATGVVVYSDTEIRENSRSAH